MNQAETPVPEMAGIQAKTSVPNVPEKADIREAYKAVTSYGNVMTGFRFTTLGFFLAAVGFIVRDVPTVRTSLVLLLLTLVVWLLELRTRSLLYMLNDSAATLEVHGMNFQHEWMKYAPFLRVVGTLRDVYGVSDLQSYKRIGSNIENLPEVPGPRLFFWRLPNMRRLTHSLALDLIYGVVCAIAIIGIIEGSQPSASAVSQTSAPLVTPVAASPSPDSNP